jgi:hypothetical protein
MLTLLIIPGSTKLVRSYLVCSPVKVAENVKAICWQPSPEDVKGGVIMFHNGQIDPGPVIYVRTVVNAVHT